MPDWTQAESVVPRNATLESLLRQENVPADLTTSLVDAVRGVFNPRDLQANQTYWVRRGLDGLFREFRYQINADELLRVVFRDTPNHPAASFDVEVVTLPKEYETAAVTAEISRANNSLIGAFRVSGENEQLPLQVAQIFGGEVDFNSELQLGDRIDVLFDRAVRDGEFVGYGDVRAAILTAGGRRITAFRHVRDEDSDADAFWYDEQGRSLRRQFLKSPLGFNPRVTSGFSSNRFHPVHGVRRPHLGVDFGAPTGTSVLAVAGGVVEFAAWNGEAGRMVRIRHAGGYKTAYLHLSGFASGIRPGVRVEQGQLIGRVGSSGSATGPHLDYRVMKNGTYINPVTAFRSMPAGEPIEAAQMPAFVRARDEALGEMQNRLRLALPEIPADPTVTTADAR
jgi:murein DD-endopeptidase MepM/ murein hydrolase activator NlpD